MSRLMSSEAKKFYASVKAVEASIGLALDGLQEGLPSTIDGVPSVEVDWKDVLASVGFLLERAISDYEGKVPEYLNAEQAASPQDTMAEGSDTGSDSGVGCW